MSVSAEVAQTTEQPVELGLEPVELLQHRLRGVLDALDVRAGLAGGVVAQLLRARLRRLEDRADLGRRLAGDRACGGPARDRVGDLAQVLVDGGRVVAAAAGREVPALDLVAFHGVAA